MRRPLPDRHGGQVCATHDLVAPLASTATAMRPKDMDVLPRVDRSSCAVSASIGSGLRGGDVDSAHLHSTSPTPATPGTRTSTTATRTTGTRTTASGLAPSADDAAYFAPPTFVELIDAYLDCRKRKRNTRSALAFEMALEPNLMRLYDDLLDGSYRPGRSICFAITRPKPREVWAASFRDRIPQHLLYRRIAPRIEASFIADSCACITGRGTLYGARRLEAKVRSITQNWCRPAYYLKCDLASFFVSIDKTILQDLLRRHVPAGWWRNLLDTVLMHDPRQDVDVRGSRERLALIPPHKSLFQQPAHKGLPIGNLLSQFGANVYLNVLDQFVKHRLGARYYIRYVDDFLLLHESPRWLNLAREQIEDLLADRLQLRLNPSKTILQPIPRGVDFVGQVVRPWNRRTRPRTVRSALRRIVTTPEASLMEASNSYFGLLRQATHSRTDRARLGRAVRLRGRCVDHGLTRSFRTS